MLDGKVKGRSVARTAAKMPASRSIDHYVGSRLKQEREVCGMDLSEVSDQIGTSADTIVRYERGEQRPLSNDLVALAKFYGVALREFFPEVTAQISGQLH